MVMTKPLDEIEEIVFDKLVKESKRESRERSKSYTLRASLKSDLNLALFALKMRKIILSHGAIRKNEKKKEYVVKVTSSLQKSNLKDQVRDFYGNFVTVK